MSATQVIKHLCDSPLTANVFLLQEATYQRELGSRPGDFKRYFVSEGGIPPSVYRDAAADLQQHSEKQQHQQPSHGLSPVRLLSS